MRDAQGNALAVYSSALVQNGSQYTATLKVQEYTLYGASRTCPEAARRVGTHAIDLTVSTRVWTGGSYNATSGAYSRPGIPTGTGPLNFPATGYISLVRGQKRYELSNHLGNILAVISDRKLQNTTTWNTSKVYLPDVLSYTDYYAFGWEMPGRSSGSYRYGFNGQEEDGETSLTEFKFRQYDGRVSRFLSLDPIAAQYPWNSPYAFAENRVIDGVDLEGKEFQSIHINSRFNPAIENFVNMLSPEWEFAIFNPFDALLIGRRPDEFFHNINSSAMRFSLNSGLNQNIYHTSDIDDPRRGSEVNAMRHAIWQAIITSKIGRQEAEQVGAAHESQNGAVIGGPVFAALGRADTYVDFLNNEIGRSIGEKCIDCTEKQIALAVLDHFATKGLWTVSESAPLNNADGSHTLQFMAKISFIAPDDYLNARNKIEALDEEGFNNSQQEFLMEMDEMLKLDNTNR